MTAVVMWHCGCTYRILLPLTYAKLHGYTPIHVLSRFYFRRNAAAVRGQIAK